MLAVLTDFIVMYFRHRFWVILDPKFSLEKQSVKLFSIWAELVSITDWGSVRFSQIVGKGWRSLSAVYRQLCVILPALKMGFPDLPYR